MLWCATRFDTRTAFICYIHISMTYLLWDDHIKTIRIKISTGPGILAKLRHCLPSHILVNLYYTLVHPYFDYCNIIWAKR